MNDSLTRRNALRGMISAGALALLPKRSALVPSALLAEVAPALDPKAVAISVSSRQHCWHTCARSRSRAPSLRGISA